MRKLLALLSALILAVSPIAFASSFNDNTAATAATATALAANGANCGAGQAAAGVDASGAAEGCANYIPGTAEADPTVDSSAEIVAIIGAGVYATAAQGGLADTAIQTEVDPTVDTSAEIQAIIGAGVYDTPVTAGDHLTRTSDDIDLDSEIYTKVASVAIAEPADTMDGLVQMTFPSAVTITSVACSTDTGTADIQFDERSNSTPNTGGTDVLNSALQCDSNEATTNSFANAGIAADQPLSMDIDAVASAPTKLRIFIKYTIDD